MKNPTHLYHYTSAEVCISIIESGILRLYNAVQQKDRYELRHFAEEAYNLFETIGTRDKEYYVTHYGTEYVKYTLGMMIALIECYNLRGDRFESLKRKIDTFPEGNFFKNVARDIKVLNLRFFILSCCSHQKNTHLWDEYASNGKGACVNLNISKKPYHLGVKPVTYQDSCSNKRNIQNVTDMIFSKRQKPIDMFNELVKNITDLSLSIKQPKFFQEEEYRIVHSTDNLVAKYIIPISDHDGREYTEIDTRAKGETLHIESIYITDKTVNADKIRQSCSKYDIPVITLEEEM